MCISADVDFDASIGAIGVATSRHVREPRTVLLAAIRLPTRGWRRRDAEVTLPATSRAGGV